MGTRSASPSSRTPNGLSAGRRRALARPPQRRLFLSRARRGCRRRYLNKHPRATVSLYIVHQKSPRGRRCGGDLGGGCRCRCAAAFAAARDGSATANRCVALRCPTSAIRISSISPSSCVGMGSNHATAAAGAAAAAAAAATVAAAMDECRWQATRQLCLPPMRRGPAALYQGLPKQCVQPLWPDWPHCHGVQGQCCRPPAAGRLRLPALRRRAAALYQQLPEQRLQCLRPDWPHRHNMQGANGAAAKPGESPRGSA